MKGLWIIAILLGTATFVAAQAAAPSDHVLFRMNWPQKFAAEVVDFRSQATNAKTVPESSSVTFQYSVNGLNDGAGYLLKNSIGKVEVDSNLPASMNRFIQDVVEVSNRNFPVIRVSTAGAISIPNFETGVSQSIAEMHQKAHSKTADVMARHLFSAPHMAAAIQDQWGRMVQMWNGVDLKIGSWYQVTTYEYVSQLGAVVPSEFYFRVVSRVPCGPGSANRDCVLIEGKSVPNEKDMGATATEDARVVTMFTLVTDPATLLPYMYQESRESLFGSANAVMVARIKYRYL